jgi:hypothetical protein
MSDAPEPNPPPRGQFLVYRAEDGRLKIDARLEGETAWLTQAQMAELFQTTIPNVSMHIHNVFAEGELAAAATVKKFLTVRQEGNRQVSWAVEYYNLDARISVGYRVKSAVATRFRIWATQKLREFIVKGFVLDDERLKTEEAYLLTRDARQRHGGGLPPRTADFPVCCLADFPTRRPFAHRPASRARLQTRSADILVCRSADFPVGQASPTKWTSESSRRPAGRKARDTAERNVCATPDGQPTSEWPADWSRKAGCDTPTTGAPSFIKVATRPETPEGRPAMKRGLPFTGRHSVSTKARRMRRNRQRQPSEISNPEICDSPALIGYRPPALPRFPAPTGCNISSQGEQPRDATLGAGLQDPWSPEGGETHSRQNRPQNAPARLPLVQTLAAMKKVRPEILPEFKDQLARLQPQIPLSEPAHGVAQRILNEGLAP